VIRTQKNESIRLDSGVTLIVVPDSSAPATAIAIGVRLGRSEERSQPGIASLLMRLLGSDSEGRPTSLLQRDVDGFGALGTEYDGNVLTGWTVCGPTEQGLSDATQTLLLNVFSQPRFSDPNLTTARQLQARALTLAEEGLLPSLLAAVRSRAFGTEATLFGDTQSLASVRVETVQAFYERFFRPDRTVVAVVGRTDLETAKRYVNTALGAGGYSDRTAGPKETLTLPEPVPSGLRDRVLSERSATALAVGYLAPGLALESTRTDWPTLMLLDAVLGGGKACRLFKLRDEKDLAYEVRTQLLPGRDASFWSAYVLGDVAPSVTKAALLALLTDLSSGKKPVTEAELNRARTYLLGRHTADRQLVLRRARAAAWTVAMGLDVRLETNLIRPLEAVTLADVNRLAKTIFGANPAFARTA
jgi:zinc protease